MSPFRLTPDSPSSGIRQSDANSTPLSLKRSIVTGGIGFSIASLCVFATVAFAQKWMYDHLSVTGAYIAWITLFILLGGGALFPLAGGRWRLLRFYAIFGAAFFLYGISWMAAYFTFRNAVGEWLGGFVGSVLMALVFAAGYGALRSAPLLSALLFIASSIGYFLGSIIYYSLDKPVGMLLWGVVYGFCFGAGLGGALCLAQSRRERLASRTADSDV